MLFFEYYTKYNSSPTEHEVFTSPPTERSIYFVHHHVLPLSMFIFQEHSSVSELMLQGSPRPLRCPRTLARPHSCSGTLARPRSCSGTLARPRLCSGTRQTTLRPRLGDFVARSSTCAQGLLDHSPTMARRLCVSTTCDWRLAYSWDVFSHLDLATSLIPRLLASSGTTSVRCTCRCILYRLYND